MTNILDDILAVANGGYSADKLLAYIDTLANGEAEAKKLQAEYQAEADREGLLYTVRDSDGGYAECSIKVGKFQSDDKGNPVYSITATATQMRFHGISKTCKSYGSPDVHHFIQAGARLVEANEHSWTFKFAKVQIQVECAKKVEDKHRAYMGLTPLQIKTKLEAELLSQMTQYRYNYYNNSRQLPKVFFQNDILGHGTNSMMSYINVQQYRTLVKLLFPTINIRVEGKDLNTEEIRRAIVESDAKPRDFGIRNLDTLLGVWAALLKQSLPAGVTTVEDKPASYKIEDLVAFITKHGGTLHGGKVGVRKNFNKKEATNG